ncbi:18890_t:CDS:1, partial [Funneliformis geosporum]
QISNALIQFSKDNEDVCLAQSQSSVNTTSLLEAKQNALPF